MSDALDLSMIRAAREVRREFLDRIEPLRPDLYAYCRRLTGHPFDAEDLVQESLARAFSQAAQAHNPIEQPRAWLFRVATNAYVDSYRRHHPLLTEVPDRPAPSIADPAEVRDAWKELVTLLPPQERAAVALKDLFSYTLAEVAEVLGTTTGAVKAALHRGRSRLDSPGRAASLATRAEPDRRLLDAVAEAFTAYDVPRLTALLLADADSEIVGMVTEYGVDDVRRGSIEHTLDPAAEVRYSAEVRQLWGEALLVIRSSKGGSAPAVNDLIRIVAQGGRVRSIRWYYFSPHVLEEVAEALGEPVELNGYRY